MIQGGVKLRQVANDVIGSHQSLPRDMLERLIVVELGAEDWNSEYLVILHDTPAIPACFR